MKRQQSESSNRHKQEHIFFTIPIARYNNRANNKKPPNKAELKLEVFKEKLLVKQQNHLSEWVLIDVLGFDIIDKVQEKEKTQEKYTLIKFEFNNVSEKEKEDKAVTFRVQDIARGRDMSAFIKKRLQNLQNTLKRSNYIKIQERQENAMKYIIQMEHEYDEVFKKAVQKQLFPTNSRSSMVEFQRILLADHPQMKKFKLMKHTMKYEQEKNILLQKLSENAEQAQRQELQQKQQKFRRNHSTEIAIESSNFNLQAIEQDLNKIQKEGRQALEGYSSKNEFEGVNVRGGDDELYQKIRPAPYDHNERNETLILSNIKKVGEDAEESLMDEVYQNFAIQNSLKKTQSADRRQGQKMEIEDGEIQDFGQKLTNGGVKYCQKMKIGEGKETRLQQKREQHRYQKKSEIKFIDPSYSYEKELAITKQSVIWCRLFYHYLKEGGIQKRENELTIIENELKRLKHIDKEAKMNESVAKMVDRVSANFLRMKRGQDVY